MKKTIKGKLMEEVQKTFPIFRYNRLKGWFDTHFDRWESNFGFADIGSKVKVDMYGEYVDVEIVSFIITEELVGVNTTQGNVWYYECEKI